MLFVPTISNYFNTKIIFNCRKGGLFIKKSVTCHRPAQILRLKIIDNIILLRSMTNICISTKLFVRTLDQFDF